MSLTGRRQAALGMLGVIVVLGAAASPVQPNPVRHPLAYGYYAVDDPVSWASLQARGHRLAGVISTSYAIVDTDGRIAGTHDARIIDLARARGHKVHARVSNFVDGVWNREIAHAILTDPGARDRAVSEILQLLDHGYDGIHLVLQNVTPRDRHALSAFVFELSTRIHTRGRVFSIAVPGKSTDQLSHEWTGAFNYAALAKASDWMVVMAYHDDGPQGPPGPIASLPWVEGVLRYASRTVPHEKLILGIALYGRVWSNNTAEVISMSEAQRRATALGAKIQWDQHAQAPYYATPPHTTVYFENARSVELRVILATRYGAAGVALWRLGYENAEVWDSLGTFLRSSVRSASR